MAKFGKGIRLISERLQVQVLLELLCTTEGKWQSMGSVSPKEPGSIPGSSIVVGSDIK